MTHPTALKSLSSCLTMALVALAGMSLAVPAVAQTPDGSVDAISEEIRKFDGRISKMEKRYLKPAKLAAKYKTEARFNDARVAYFMGDHNRAAVLFVDLVNDDGFQRTESYREALFLLGESLHEVRNHRAAQRYLTRLLRLGPGSFFEEAAKTLLEIAYQTRNFELVDEVQGQISAGSVSPALSYVSGKALYEKGEYQRAREALARAAQSDQYNMVARYFRGVVFAAEKKFDEAARVFRDIAENAQPASQRESEVVDLAWIGLGRVAYETGDVETAIDAYSTPKRKSPHFDRALWELTWVLVAKEMYKEARRNVDLLLMSDPDPTFVPEAKILRADLSLRMNEYASANEDYKEVVDTFEPVKNEMDAFVARQDDVEAFFGALVKEEVSAAEPEYMPPLVSQWVEEDPAMKRATGLISDVRSVNVDVEDSLRMLDEIQARLESGTRVQSFPTLAEGMSVGIQMESRLIQLRKQLLQAEYKALKPSLSSSARQQWEAIQSELSGLQQKFEEMPKTRSELSKRERAVMHEFDRLRRQLDRVGYQIDSQQAQLNAVNAYLREDYGRELTAEERERIENLKEEVRNNIAALQDVRQEIKHELQMARQSVGVGDPVVQAERRLRQQYRDELAQARQFLTSHRGSASGSAAQKARRIDQVRNRIDPLEARLKGYFAEMDSLIDEKVDELREDLQTERELVVQHRNSLQEMITESRTGAGVLAYLNFMRTRAKFNDLVLRGDVGLTDVAWSKKEEMTNQINQLFEDRTSQLQLLEESFEEVR